MLHFPKSYPPPHSLLHISLHNFKIFICSIYFFSFWWSWSCSTPWFPYSHLSYSMGWLLCLTSPHVIVFPFIFFKSKRKRWLFKKNIFMFYNWNYYSLTPSSLVLCLNFKKITPPFLAPKKRNLIWVFLSSNLLLLFLIILFYGKINRK